MIINHENFCRGLDTDMFSAYVSLFLVATYEIGNSKIVSKDLFKHIKRK